MRNSTRSFRGFAANFAANTIVVVIGKAFPTRCFSLRGDAQDDHYRLLEAITAFLRAAAQHQPPVLVLEDLHDADRGTLDLLIYAGRGSSSRATL